MGNSAEAVIAFGIDFGDHEPEGIDYYRLVEEAIGRLLAERGFADYRQDGYFAAKDEVEAGFPVEYLRYGYGDGSGRHFLAVRGTVIETEWGCKPIDPAAMTADPERVAAFRGFVAAAGLKTNTGAYDAEGEPVLADPPAPGWHLMPYYG